MAATTRTTRVRPPALRWIFGIMMVGAATSIGAGLLGFTQRSELEAEYRQRIADGLQIDVTKVASVVQTTIVGGMVLACVLAAIWVVLALLLMRQSRPARWVSTVLCAINVIAALLWAASVRRYGLGGTPIGSAVAQSVSFLCALGTLLLLWTQRVRIWFAPESPREAAEKVRLEGMSIREARAARIERQQHQRAAARDLRRGKTPK
jgi:hypothetical protein